MRCCWGRRSLAGWVGGWGRGGVQAWGVPRDGELEQGSAGKDKVCRAGMRHAGGPPQHLSPPPRPWSTPQARATLERRLGELGPQLEALRQQHAAAVAALGQERDGLALKVGRLVRLQRLTARRLPVQPHDVQLLLCGPGRRLRMHGASPPQLCAAKGCLGHGLQAALPCPVLAQRAACRADVPPPMGHGAACMLRPLPNAHNVCAQCEEDPLPPELPRPAPPCCAPAAASACSGLGPASAAPVTHWRKAARAHAGRACGEGCAMCHAMPACPPSICRHPPTPTPTRTGAAVRQARL